MKSCNKCHIEKALTEFYLRSNRKSLREICKVCGNLAAMERHRQKPMTKEQRRANSARFRANNPRYHYAYSSVWQKANPQLTRGYKAKRRATRLNATPKWLSAADLLALKLIYSLCPKGLEVDHVVPLQGTTVMGLHVPWNLQYLTVTENRSKSNRLVG